MTDTEMGLKEAARELNKFKRFLDAAKYIEDTLSAAVKAEGQMNAYKKLSADLMAECGQLEEKRNALQAALDKKREDGKASLDAFEKDASEKKRGYRKQVDEVKTRSQVAIGKMQKEFTDRQLQLKEERAELEAGARALRATVQDDIAQLENQRVQAEKTITGLKTRLSKAVG
jgi:predicted  nucleic acid-binding Zn-ribbon protein